MILKKIDYPDLDPRGIRFSKHHNLKLFHKRIEPY